MTGVWAELWLLRRDRAAIFWLSMALLVSGLAVAGGLHEVRSQRATIQRLVAADGAQRQRVAAKQSDWGSVAYHTFHLTYDPPSPLAFAALGQRELLPWKHRIRMLALEGQIHEADTSNPALAIVGPLDFAFVASTLLPLFVIFLLHSLRSAERAAGRWELLVATAGHARRWLVHRAAVRLALLFTCTVVPFAVGCLVEGTSLASPGKAVAAVAAYTLFWWAVAELVGRRARTSSVCLTVLVGVWLGLAVLAPTAIQAVVDRFVSAPRGATILMTQREAVNGAWDLPKAETMAPFVKRHPEWREHAAVQRPFEWKWYFAFQHLGDQRVEGLSQRYQASRASRDQMAGWLSWLAPPVWLARSLQSLAQTDTGAALAYEGWVRAFHSRLRSYYYPKLFLKEPFEPTELEQRPEFEPRGRLP